MLLQVLSADVDVFHQALASVCPPLLDRVLGTQSEDGHVFERQAEATQTPVELLGEALPHLVALILARDRKTTARSSDETQSGQLLNRGEVLTLMTSEHS